MTWFLAVLVVVAIGGVAVVAAGHGAPLGPAYADRPDVDVPAEGPLGPEDLRAVRFTTAVRGYRADEVDALLERLAAQLDADRDGGTVPEVGTAPQAGAAPQAGTAPEPGDEPGREGLTDR